MIGALVFYFEVGKCVRLEFGETVYVRKDGQKGHFWPFLKEQHPATNAFLILRLS